MKEHKCDHNHNHHHHEHGHVHGHGHHHHHHAPANYNKVFMIGISLNIIFVVVEALFGVFSNSLALLSDAGHNLSDVAGLIIAWGAFWLGTRKPTKEYTFGMRKSSILSALLNSIFLMAAVGIIIWEAIHRIASPNVIDSKTVIIVAMIGIVINSATAMLFFKDKNTDINLKGAYHHCLRNMGSFKRFFQTFDGCRT
jgi:cobalt-zinc-cadmium efflux system protein